MRNFQKLKEKNTQCEASVRHFYLRNSFTPSTWQQNVSLTFDWCPIRISAATPTAVMKSFVF